MCQERYCSKCGKKLTHHNINDLCYDCSDREYYVDKLWDEYFETVEQRQRRESEESN